MSPPRDMRGVETTVAVDVRALVRRLHRGHRHASATRARDAEFYRQYLADDAIAVLPVGVMGKEAIVRAVEHSAFQSTGLSDTRVVVLGPDAGVAPRS